MTINERIELRDGGLLLCDDAFLTPNHAGHYFENLRDHCQWEQKPGIFGDMHVQENHEGMTAMMEHFAVFVVTFLSVGCASAVDESPFRITTKRDNDIVEVTVKMDKSVISVHSPFGISQAVIERSDEKWPDSVILRLHLKGLENFKVSNGKVTLEAAVSSQDSTLRLWEDGKEDSPLDSRSQYWMEIRLVGNDGKSTKMIPLDDGCFEMQLPKALFEGNPKSITVNWIDFYR